VALVFGREESGLLESELMLCSHACSIPSGVCGDKPCAVQLFDKCCLAAQV
jgi:hypothetical protein